MRFQYLAINLSSEEAAGMTGTETDRLLIGSLIRCSQCSKYIPDKSIHEI